MNVCSFISLTPLCYQIYEYSVLCNYIIIIQYLYVIEVVLMYTVDIVHSRYTCTQ